MVLPQSGEYAWWEMTEHGHPVLFVQALPGRPTEPLTWYPDSLSTETRWRRRSSVTPKLHYTRVIHTWEDPQVTFSRRFSSKSPAIQSFGPFHIAEIQGYWDLTSPRVESIAHPQWPHFSIRLRIRGDHGDPKSISEAELS